MCLLARSFGRLTRILHYGRKQVGAEVGYDPKKPVRPSHHPLVAFLPGRRPMKEEGPTLKLNTINVRQRNDIAFIGAHSNLVQGPGGMASRFRTGYRRLK